MKEDLRSTALPGDAGEQDARGGAGRSRALELLRQIEAISPGVIEQMAASLQLARLPRANAH